MSDIRVTTTTGAEGAIAEAAVEEFKSKLRGELLQSGDQGYDDARAIFNGMIDRRPALIARCAGVADVIDCVNFARGNNVLVSVRGGGQLRVRRWPDDRPVKDEQRLGRSGAAYGARRRGRHLARF